MVEAFKKLGHWISGGPPYAETLTQIENLAALERGWNGYRAGRVTEEARRRASGFVALLPNIGPVPAPSVAPTPNGGVALRWRTPRREVEIIFLAVGGEYSVSERGSQDIIDGGSIDAVDLLKDIVRDHVVQQLQRAAPLVVAAPPFVAGEEITTGVLYRRIFPHPDYWVDDEDPKRPSSLNFFPDTGEPYVSMDLKDEDDPNQARKILEHPDARPGSGLFEIDVETLREFRLTVTYEPEYGERHFGVRGWEHLGTKEAVRVRRKLSFRTRVKEPPKIVPRPAPGP